MYHIYKYITYINIFFNVSFLRWGVGVGFANGLVKRVKEVFQTMLLKMLFSLKTFRKLNKRNEHAMPRNSVSNLYMPIIINIYMYNYIMHLHNFLRELNVSHSYIYYIYTYTYSVKPVKITDSNYCCILHVNYNTNYFAIFLSYLLSFFKNL